jgi:hypothetical protein
MGGVYLLTYDKTLVEWELNLRKVLANSDYSTTQNSNSAKLIQLISLCQLRSPMKTSLRAQNSEPKIDYPL